MRQRGAKRARPALLVLFLLFALTSELLSACLPDVRKRQSVTVASAKTPEQMVLGQLTLLTLNAAGYAVVDRVGFADEWAVRRALEAGTVDVVWAYTGDVWTSWLGHDQPIADAGELYRRVRDEDRWNGILWLPPAPCERSAGLVMTEKLAAGYKVRTVSDLARLLASREPDLTLCAPEWFYEQAGGLRGLERVYQLYFAPDKRYRRSIEEGYAGLRRGECDCALGYGNDVEVIGGELRMLRDDKGFFLASSLAVAVRAATAQEFPDLQQHLAELTQLLDEQAMAELYGRTAIRGESPRRAAQRFLKERGLLGRGRRKRS